jgi:hypothetical protein
VETELEPGSIIRSIAAEPLIEIKRRRAGTVVRHGESPWPIARLAPDSSLANRAAI